MGKHRTPTPISAKLTLTFGITSIVLFLAFFVGVLFSFAALSTGSYSLKVYGQQTSTVVGLVLASASLVLFILSGTIYVVAEVL